MSASTNKTDITNTEHSDWILIDKAHELSGIGKPRIRTLINSGAIPGKKSPDQRHEFVSEKALREYYISHPNTPKSKSHGWKRDEAPSVQDDSNSAQHATSAPLAEEKSCLSLALASPLVTMDAPSLEVVPREARSDHDDFAAMPEEELCKKIRSLDKSATQMVHTVQTTFNKSLELVIKTGEALLEMKHRLKHGEWDNWLAINLPEIPRSRVSRYTSLAKQISHMPNFDTTKTIRQAYLATGVIKEPAAVKKEANGSGDLTAEAILNRASTARKAIRLFLQKNQVNDLAPEIKSRLRMELREFAELLNLLEEDGMEPVHEDKSID